MELNLYGQKYNEKPSIVRAACRAVIIKDGRILISYENKNGQLMIPGGGIEINETLEECLIREIEEETGFIVKTKQKLVTINEYYEDYLWINHYFICEIIGSGNIKLSDVELKEDMEAKWFDFVECLNIFKDYKKYEETDKMRCGMYKREYLALTEYLKIKE